MALAILLAIPRLYTHIAGETLFLASYDLSTLPELYVVMAVLVAATASLFMRLERRLPLRTLLVWSLSSSIALLVLQWLLAKHVSDGWPAMVVFVWKEIEIFLLFATLWGVAARLFNVTEAKRLFALVGSGMAATMLVGGLTTSLVLEVIDARDLLLLSAGGTALGLVVLVHLLRRFDAIVEGGVAPRDAVAAGAGGGAEATAPLSWRTIFRIRYAVLMFANAFIAAFCYFFFLAILYDRLATRYPEPADLAAFLGVLTGVIGVATVAARALFTGRVLMRFGVGVGLLALPIVFLLGVITAGVVWHGFEAMGVVFWLVVGIRLVERTFDQSLSEMAVRILYQPFPKRERLFVQAADEGVMGPLSVGVAGVTLMVLVDVVGLDAGALLIIVAGLLLVRVAVGVMLARGYADELAKRVRELAGAVPAPARMPGPEARRILEDALAGPRAEGDGAALEALRSRVWEALPSLADPLRVAGAYRCLQSADPEARAFALELLQVSVPGPYRAGLVTLLDATEVDVEGAARVVKSDTAPRVSA